MMFPVQGKAFCAVFLSFRKFLYQGLLYKPLTLGMFDGRSKFFGPVYLRDAAAARAVQRLYDQRILQGSSRKVFN